MLFIYILLANSMCWPLLSFFTGQLNVLACHHFFYWPTQHVGLSSFFLPANSTCWPVTIFFTGQLNVLACHDYSQMDLIGSCYSLSREILLEVLTIDSDRKLDIVQFLEHVCIPRQNLINLVRPVPSWRPLAIFSIFSSQW